MRFRCRPISPPSTSILCSKYAVPAINTTKKMASPRRALVLESMLVLGRETVSREVRGGQRKTESTHTERQSAHCTRGCGLGRRRSCDGARGKVSEPVCGDVSGERGNKNPEVVLLRHLNQQLALDPCRPLFAGCSHTQRTILTWAPGLLPTGLGCNASGSYLAFDLFLVLSTSGSLSTVAVPLVPLRCRRGAVN